MFAFLKNHPFAVEAHFESSIVLTFAAPEEQLRHLIPECLELDTFDDKWAFLAVAMVQTKGLRPKGFPQFLGNDFFLIGYRVFVRYTNNEGKRVRGLYILKSETDRRKMEYLGNAFTHYNYTTTDISHSTKGPVTTISSNKSGFEIKVAAGSEEEVDLPADSPFTTWKEGRRFAGPLPFTFTFQSEKQSVLIIEGVRQNWHPAPISVISYEIPFLHSLGAAGVVLANAFRIDDIPYWWKKGRIETWKR